MVRVLLVDDEPGIRVVVRTALRLRGDIQIVGEATTSFSAAQLAVEHEPDLVVLDLGLPDSSGAQSYLDVQAAAPDSQFVIYSGSDAERPWFSERGVSFVGKDGDLAELLETVERTAER
jgi:DNA-binding NarL/FixJ family response regulator